MKINESGRSMIEMLGVLAIIGVLSVGGIAGYSKAMSKYRVNKTVDQISHIAANTRILFSTQKSYSALNGTNAPNIISHAKLFPDDLLKADNKNPFGGDVTLTASKRFSGDDADTNTLKAFTIKYTDIPGEACVDLLTIDWGTGTAGGIIAVGTADVDAKDAEITSGYTFKDTDKFTAGAMSVKKAVELCDDDNSNTLYFKFY